MTQNEISPDTSVISRKMQLRKLLSRRSGATIAQIQDTFNWKQHTARAAISALRKAGDYIERDKSEQGSVYRIVKRGASK